MESYKHISKKNPPSQKKKSTQSNIQRNRIQSWTLSKSKNDIKWIFHGSLDNAFFSHFVKLSVRLNYQTPVKQKATSSNTFKKQQIKYMSMRCWTEWECQTCQNCRHFLYQVARLFIKSCIPAQHKSSFHPSDASDLIITTYNFTWIR